MLYYNVVFPVDLSFVNSWPTLKASSFYGWNCKLWLHFVLCGVIHHQAWQVRVGSVHLNMTWCSVCFVNLSQFVKCVQYSMSKYPSGYFSVVRRPFSFRFELLILHAPPPVSNLLIHKATEIVYLVDGVAWRLPNPVLRYLHLPPFCVSQLFLTHRSPTSYGLYYVAL